MTATARSLKRNNSHKPSVVLAVVTRRAGDRNLSRRVFFLDVPKVFVEMCGVVIDDPCASPERVGIECRMTIIEAVEFHRMTGSALLIGDLVQIEIDALVLLMTACAVNASGNHLLHRQGSGLRARGQRLRAYSCNIYKPQRALPQDIS
ncbi:hypothetical protein [Hyphomicrobium sp. DY-1]|uniref:hypothetical protein n=1 Tax=Hyphomicrobium sp. DY-1 TaxID=3075650 RepID=UPI0039C22F2A